MKIQLFTTAIVTFLIIGSLGAQPNKKLSPALSKFLNTEFMVKFQDLRVEAESAVIGIQARQNQGQLQTADIYRLRAAYDQTAQRANRLLSTIKEDFMNQKKLKTISEFPEMYSDGLQFKLKELSDHYSTNFQQALADATNQEVDGSAILLLVTELIGLTKGLADYFADIKREAKQYTESYLQENFIAPYRWRYWDELAGGTSLYEKFEMQQNNNFNDPNQTDRLDQQIQNWNQKLQNDQYNNYDNNYSDPYYNNAPTNDPNQNWQPDTTSTQQPDENPFQYDNDIVTPPQDSVSGRAIHAPATVPAKPQKLPAAKKQSNKRDEK